MTTSVAPLPRVAICFAGFLRNATLTETIQNKMGGDATYDAFVETWSDQFELDRRTDAVPVSGRHVCKTLRSQGFDRCRYDVLNYDPGPFYNATSSRCILERGKYGLPIYPHRLASYLSMFTRCMESIQDAERVAAARFDAIVLTRMDSINRCRRLPARHFNHKSAWDTRYDARRIPSHPWSLLAAHDAVATRASPSHRRVHDQLIVGRRDAMQRFALAYSKYVGFDYMGGNASDESRGGTLHNTFTEAHLFRLLEDPVFNATLKLAAVDDFFSFSQDDPAGSATRRSYCFFHHVLLELRLSLAELAQMVDAHRAHEQSSCSKWVEELTQGNATQQSRLHSACATKEIMPGIMGRVDYKLYAQP